MYYSGTLRQRGSGLSGGLGNVLKAFARSTIFKGLANKITKKAIGTAVKFGVGVLRDVKRRKTLKQAVKDRGKNLIENLVRSGGKRVLDGVLNSGTPAKKRHKATVPRRVNTRRKKIKPRSRDIFD